MLASSLNRVGVVSLSRTIAVRLEPHGRARRRRGGRPSRTRLSTPAGLVLEGRPNRRHTGGQDRPTTGPSCATPTCCNSLSASSSRWRVQAASFGEEAHRLDIEIDFTKGGRFLCPHCAKTVCPVRDTAMQTWRHLDFFQHQAFLQARMVLMFIASGAVVVPLGFTRSEAVRVDQVRRGHPGQGRPRRSRAGRHQSWVPSVRVKAPVSFAEG